ncbi:enoyl CoA hydratase domain-containing protein 1 [Quaeritorhiza haematococci]|nr:enoyl CoA hydratase domain-containing protein 1 [Quaeritorhiza haematococci]
MFSAAPRVLLFRNIPRPFGRPISISSRTFSTVDDVVPRRQCLFRRPCTSHRRYSTQKLTGEELDNLTFPRTVTEIRSLFRRFDSDGKVTFDPNFSPGVGLITLRNTRRRNALSPAMMVDFADIVDRLEEIVAWKEPAERGLAPGLGVGVEGKEGSDMVAVVLTGEGGTFCSGFDLTAAQTSFLSPEAGQAMSLLMHHTIARFLRLPLVSVAAIDGYALGGGAELTTATDHRIMTEDATLRFVQVKMGVVPGWGGGTRLTRLIGRSNALRLLGTTTKPSPTMLLQTGFADSIVPPGPNQALEGALRFLDPYVFDHPTHHHHSSIETHQYGGVGLKEARKDWRRHSVEAVRGMKRVVVAAAEGGGPCEEHRDQDWDCWAMREERKVFGELWGGPDNIEAVRQSAQRRKG